MSSKNLIASMATQTLSSSHTPEYNRIDRLEQMKPQPSTRQSRAERLGAIAAILVVVAAGPAEPQFRGKTPMVRPQLPAPVVRATAPCKPRLLEFNAAIKWRLKARAW